MGKLNLEPEERVVLLSRIGRFIKRMLRINTLSKEIRDSSDFDNVRQSTKDKIEEIEVLSSKKEKE